MKLVVAAFLIVTFLARNNHVARDVQTRSKSIHPVWMFNCRAVAFQRSAAVTTMSAKFGFNSVNVFGIGNTQSNLCSDFTADFMEKHAAAWSHCPLFGGSSKSRDECEGDRKGGDFQIFTPHPGPLPVWRGEGVVNCATNPSVTVDDRQQDPIGGSEGETSKCTAAEDCLRPVCAPH